MSEEIDSIPFIISRLPSSEPSSRTGESESFRSEGDSNMEQLRAAGEMSGKDKSSKKITRLLSGHFGDRHVPQSTLKGFHSLSVRNYTFAVRTQSAEKANGLSAVLDPKCVRFILFPKQSQLKQ